MVYLNRLHKTKGNHIATVPNESTAGADASVEALKLYHMLSLLALGLAGADASVEALKLYHMLSLLALALKLYHMLSLLALLARALVARIVQKMGNDRP